MTVTIKTKGRVLIIDDSEVVRKILSDQLGFEEGEIFIFGSLKKTDL